ncbi:MAG: ABC transporter permease [Chloroflexi bacterium]|nr:MAG: ABC transporter permease [Chloroflexota bacterium]
MIDARKKQPNQISLMINGALNTLVRMLGGAGMVKFLIRRTLAAIPVLFAIMLVTFTLTHLLPGGPFDAAGQRRMPDYMVRQLEQKFGLDKPVLFNTWDDGHFPDGDDWRIAGYRDEIRSIGGGPNGEVINKTEKVFRIDFLDSQFFNYVWCVLHLAFGPSLSRALRNQNVQVSDEITRRLPVSMRIGVFAVIMGFSLGVPLGVLAAVYHNTIVDWVAMFFAVLSMATPGIVLAPILIIIFAVELEWVPVADTKDQWRRPELSLYYLQILALPVITLGTGMAAGIARLTRASLLQVLHEDYVRTARAKGLRERVVIYVHALKNAMIPVATILGPLLAGVLTGTFVVELIFVIPGLGEVFINSVGARDYTMIMGVSILYSVLLIMGNILVDVMYTWLDPRIRFD